MTAAAADYWTAKSVTGYQSSWYGLCAAEITRRVTGQTAIGMSHWLLRKHTPGVVGAFLEVGCLTGKKTLTYKRTFAREVAGVDYAAGAIEAGKAEYGDAIDLRVMDLNKPTPMGRTFDVIFANGVLHHIENLEACAEWMREHLNPGGVVIASEYTGPVRYRYSKREVDIINAGVAMLPAELQREFDPTSLQGKLNADPSEAIRSRDITTVFRAIFGSVEETPYGGNVLMRAIDPREFFKTFDPRNPTHTDAVARLVAFDLQVMNQEPSHHTVMVARHAKHPLQ